MTWLIPILLKPCTSRFAAALTSVTYPQLDRHLNTSSRALPQVQALESIELTSPVTYISESNDPWFNLSYEDWLLRNTPHSQPILFVYRNRPCVVIGRNQNPWKETTPRRLRETGIPLIRRRSGGGTVYHDMGNTNFSIILPRLLFTRDHGAKLVARAVRERLGIPGCDVNERNDVIIRDSRLGREFKDWLDIRRLHVSGSAYKIIQNRAYHHGTMLISSSISELGKSLKSSSPNIITKGIPSHPSPVTTLNTYLSTPTSHSQFVEAITGEFEAVYAPPGGGFQMDKQIVREEDVNILKIWDGVKEMKSWEWQYGQTPEFTNHLEGDLSFGPLSVSMTSRHALINSLTFHYSSGGRDLDRTRRVQTYLDGLALRLVGKRYETLDGVLEIDDDDAESGTDHVSGHEVFEKVGQEIVEWLRRVM